MIALLILIIFSVIFFYLLLFISKESNENAEKMFDNIKNVKMNNVKANFDLQYNLFEREIVKIIEITEYSNIVVNEIDGKFDVIYHNFKTNSHNFIGHFNTEIEMFEELSHYNFFRDFLVIYKKL